MKVASSISVIALALFVTHCATIIHGTTQELGVTSSPSGARVEVDGTDQGDSPVTVELGRKEKHTVRISLDGYEPYEVIVNRKISGWVWGNIIFLGGGVIGLAIDAVTGGMYQLSPDQISAQLRNSGSAASVRDGQLFVFVVLVPNGDWRQIGSLTSSE